MDLEQLRPVARRSMEALATDSLRDFILSGTVKPGSRLIETALAGQLGIARATLRTGLQQLTNEGLVERIPYVGWQLIDLTADDAWEIWTLRGSLERLATSLVAENNDPKVLAAVREAFETLQTACRDEADMRDISEHDFYLHRRLVELCGHRRLARQYELVEQQVRLFITTSNAYASDGPEDIVAQHKPIIDAIIEGDPVAAGRAAWRHNEREGRRLASWLASEQENAKP